MLTVSHSNVCSILHMRLSPSPWCRPKHRCSQEACALHGSHGGHPETASAGPGSNGRWAWPVGCNERTKQTKANRWLKYCQTRHAPQLREMPWRSMKIMKRCVPSITLFKPQRCDINCDVPSGPWDWQRPSLQVLPFSQSSPDPTKDGPGHCIGTRHKRQHMLQHSSYRSRCHQKDSAPSQVWRPSKRASADTTSSKSHRQRPGSKRKSQTNQGPGA